jgi:hypothetical protein
MKKHNKFKNKKFVIIFSLLVMFVLSGVSFASALSDIQCRDQTPKMHLNSRGLVDSGDCNFEFQNTDRRGVNGKQQYTEQYTEQPHAAPIPAAVWLFGTGLVGLFGIRRKLQK